LHHYKILEKEDSLQNKENNLITHKSSYFYGARDNPTMQELKRIAKFYSMASHYSQANPYEKLSF